MLLKLCVSRSKNNVYSGPFMPRQNGQKEWRQTMPSPRITSVCCTSGLKWLCTDSRSFSLAGLMVEVYVWWIKWDTD